MINKSNKFVRYSWQPTGIPNKHIAEISLKHSLELIPKVHMFQMDVKAEQV